MCYTSGTTGNPKGALYSHRSTVLHAYCRRLARCAWSSGARDSVLPVVPMFHVNAWGLPYSAAMTGAKLVFPGPALDGKSIYELFETEKVTFAAGVPTVWQMLLAHMAAAASLQFSSLEAHRDWRLGLPAGHDHGLQRRLRRGSAARLGHDRNVARWARVCTLKNKHLDLPEDEQNEDAAQAGRAIFGVDMKIVDADGNELPWDGKAFGDLLVRGPWIIKRYFKGEGGDPLVDGWFPTGDVATIDPDGYMQITDRSKDVIKSGGEWISSIDVENIAMAHPARGHGGVHRHAHPKWDERPIVVVVQKAWRQRSAREELLDVLRGQDRRSGRFPMTWSLSTLSR
jgi:fatty-acyl-CoA synthase